MTILSSAPRFDRDARRFLRELPREEDIPDFLGHVWAFDRLRVTSEDQQRTVMYKQEVDARGSRCRR